MNDKILQSLDRLLDNKDSDKDNRLMKPLQGYLRILKKKMVGTVLICMMNIYKKLVVYKLQNSIKLNIIK